MSIAELAGVLRDLGFEKALTAVFVKVILLAEETAGENRQSSPAVPCSKRELTPKPGINTNAHRCTRPKARRITRGVAAASGSSASHGEERRALGNLPLSCLPRVSR